MGNVISSNIPVIRTQSDATIPTGDAGKCSLAACQDGRGKGFAGLIKPATVTCIEKNTAKKSHFNSNYFRMVK